MQLDPLPELFVDGLHQLHAALRAQGVGEGGLKGLPLLRGGQGRLRPEHPADELPVEQLRLAHVIQRVVEVGGAVVKGGPQEAHLRRGGQPSGGFHVEGVFVGHVAQPWLPLPHGADGAQQVGVHRVGGVVQHLVVPGAEGHVIALLCQQDEVAVLPQLQVLDHRLVKLPAGGGILQLGVPEGQEPLQLLALRHLPGGEGHVHQVAAQPAGQGLSQQGQAAFHIVLVQQGQGLVHLRDDLLQGAAKPAVHVAEIVFPRAEPPAQLAHFFLVHGIPSLVQEPVFAA